MRKVKLFLTLLLLFSSFNSAYGQVINIMPTPSVVQMNTPADDIKGPNYSTTHIAEGAEYHGLRPSVPEDGATITARTAVIQAAIDAASQSGGGKVVLPRGLFQVNQIILKDRVALVGAGMGKTVLLAAQLAAGEALIKSERYDENLAIYNNDPNDAPKWLSNNSPTNMQIRHLTIDGNGVELSYDTQSWDIDETKPNLGGDNPGIALFGSGTVLDQVGVFFCSGRGVVLHRGSDNRSGALTSADTEYTYIGTLLVHACDGDAGLFIGQFPDGFIHYYDCSRVENGAAMVIQGSAWEVQFSHVYGNKRGIDNLGRNHYDLCIVENNNEEGFRNLSDPGGQEPDGTGSEDTTIARMKAWSNQRNYDSAGEPQGGPAGKAHVLLEERAHINFAKLDLQDTASDSDLTELPRLTGIKLEANAAGSTIKGNAQIVHGADYATIVDAVECVANRCDIDLQGFVVSVPGATVYQASAFARGGKIRFKYGGLQGSGSAIFRTTNSSRVATNINPTRLRMHEKIEILHRGGVPEAAIYSQAGDHTLADADNVFVHELDEVLEATDVAVNEDGDALTITFRRPVYGTDPVEGFSVTPSGGGEPITYSSGLGTDELVFDFDNGTGSIVDGEMLTLDYDDATGDLAELYGQRLVSFTGEEVDNHSTQL